MIIYHKSNIAAFAGAHKSLWLGQQFLQKLIAVTTAAPANEEIEQARSAFRFVFSRVWGSVN